MKRKDCVECKYLFGSEHKPECDWYDEPIKHIENCLKRESIGKEIVTNEKRKQETD
jgi:hypothetical protein